ncbi:MAG: hypothetical protein ACTSRS_01755 [Candidatus Helarchaeota archaeon]
MSNSTLSVEEKIIRNLEEEIIDEKVKAYRIALGELYALPPILLQPFISDYQRKLHRQVDILFETVKEILANPNEKQRRIRLNFRRYYEKTELYSRLLLQIPPIFAPNFIRQTLKKLKRLNRRYFRRRINFLLVIYDRIAELERECYHSDQEFLRRVFDKKFLLEYVYSYIELEEKKFRLIQKAGDWKQVPFEDFFNTFTISAIPFYQYISNIWKMINKVLPGFLKRKVEELYHLKSLMNEQLEIVRSCKFRYKLVKEFPVSVSELKEIFHDPEILMRNYPAKQNIQIERVGPNRLRYVITEKIPLMKIVLKYDLVWQYKDNLEEWWIENSNYLKNMHGFAIYEETESGHCRYADILIDFKLDESLQPFEEVIIPELERIGRNNVEQLMENIYQELINLKGLKREVCEEFG